MVKMQTLSIVLDQETLDQIKAMQLKKGIFSRSQLIRELISKGLSNEHQIN